MKILVLDNYDSFTYNLVQYLQEITGEELDVYRNDKISLEAVAAYDAVILSPGPGVPKDAGIMPELILRYGAIKPIFGVCLGLQAIGEAYGAQLHNLERVYHGVETPVKVLDLDSPIFKGLPETFTAGRYHSWVVAKEGVPTDLLITAEDEKGVIMAMRHRSHPVFGVQFHPESIMTPQGKEMLGNFLREAERHIASLKTSLSS
ncbi:MAG: aminodeoxychorismate/anthranilate synthase component II [Bacteroidota bacterium]